MTVRNEFDGGALHGVSFPLDVVVLQDMRWRGQFELPWKVVVQLEADGSPRGTLSYIPGWQIRRGMWCDEPMVLFNEGRFVLGDGLSQFDPLHDNGTVLPKYPFYLPSRIDGIGALFLESETVIRGGITGDILRLAQRGYDAAFARDARLGALLFFQSYPDQWEVVWQPRPSRLVAFDFNGTILFRSKPTPPMRSYGQLYLSNDGSWAIVTQQGPDGSTIATDEVVFIDIQTGETLALPGMNGGARFHSPDGRYMVLFQSGWEKVHLFDLSTPTRPRLIWMREGLGNAAAAINSDGSLVAVMGMSLVTLIDSSGEVVAEAPRHNENGFGGVMFAGDFLVVGMQEHVHHGFEDAMPVTRIDAYDVGRFR